MKIATKEMKNLLQVIRCQNHKSKRAHACHYNFKCDWPVELSDKKVSNNKPSNNNLASASVEK